MLSRSAKMASVAACAGVLITPLPATAQSPVSTHREAIAPLVESVERAHDRAVRRNVRLQRSNARLLGAEVDRGRRGELQDWSVDHLRERNTELAKRNRQLKRRAARRAAAAGVSVAAATATPGAAAPGAAAPGGGATATPGHLQAIAACESGGDPSAVGGGGAYRGKYQFSPSTWASVGGSGDPAAAPEAEQDRLAALLYDRQGPSAWPTCSKRA
jgi:hypothetical protein